MYNNEARLIGKTLIIEHIGFYKYGVSEQIEPNARCKILEGGHYCSVDLNKKEITLLRDILNEILKSKQGEYK